MRSKAPWLWLFDIDPHRRALDASGETDAYLAAALVPHFDEVTVLRPDAAALDAIRASATETGWTISRLVEGTIAAAPFDDASFDCIALHDQLSRLAAAGGDVGAALVRVRSLLKPEGWLVAASHTPMPIGPAEWRRGIRRGKLAALLQGAGFSDLRCVFVEPSITSPLILVPESRDGIVAYETSVRWSSNRVRRFAARRGWWSALYPSFFMLARA